MTYGGKTWRFDGSVWLRIDKNRGGQRGAVGPQGPAGPTGAAGASGIVGSHVSSLNGLTGGINTVGLTFAFAGISTDGITVGVLGITIDGAISFSDTTGDIKNPSSSSAKIDISVGSDDFTLGRFARTDGTVTIGDVDRVSNGTRIEVNGKNEKVDVYADQKIHLHNGVLFPESGISLGVGLTFPDGTFQSSAHAPHEFVASFNGATGAVEGVNSVNGNTGAVTNVAFTNVANNFTQNNTFTSGKGFGSNGDSQPSLIFNDNFVTTIGDTEAEANNYHLKVDDQNETVQVIGGGGVEYDFGVNVLDAKGNLIKTTSRVECAGISASGGITIGGLAITGSNELTFSGTNVSITADNNISLFATEGLKIISGYTQDILFDSIYQPAPGTRISTSAAKFTVPLGEFFNISTPATIKLGDLDAYRSDTQIKISSIQTDGITGNIFMETNGTVRETFNENYRRNTDVATFTINASSSIATGAKTNSLYRIPYNATLTNFDVKASAIGGLTAAIRIAGPDFGDPLTSGITGCSLGVEGLTGSSTVFDQASVTAGNFVLLDIFSNDSGSTGTQAFLTFESR
jgi:hypothetical protein